MLLTYLAALGIPLILLLCGAITRKIARGDGWRKSDFYLGVELTLATLGSTMVRYFDLCELAAKQPPLNADLGHSIFVTTLFLGFTFFLLFWLLSTHQDWHSRDNNARGQLIWLGLISNAVGVTLFASFVMLVKGV